MKNTIAIGRTVLLTLSQAQADRINARRISEDEVHQRIASKNWQFGIQAHLGNEVAAGQTFPATIVAIRDEKHVGLRVWLDGSDDLWVEKAAEGDEPGDFKFPVIETEEANKKK